MDNKVYNELYGRCFSYSGEKKDPEKYVSVLVIIIVLAVCVCVIAFRMSVLLTTVITLAAALPFIVLYYKAMYSSRCTVYLDADGNFYLVEFVLSSSTSEELMKQSAAGLFVRNPRRSVQMNRKVMNEAGSLMDKAHDPQLASYYVNRFRQGIKDFGPMGGEAKVTALNRFSLVKKGKSSSTFEYYDGEKRKTLRLSNDFSGLTEYMAK